MAEDFRARARLVPKGNRYEDFEVGRVFRHHWGRTITESESTLFTTLTLHFNPHYYNAAYAQAHGHPGIVANPLLVFTTVFGLTVEDLSEGGGPFLGVNELTYHQPVYPSDSLRAESVVLDRRVSDSHKGFGIVTWHSKGFNQREELVIDFKRTKDGVPARVASIEYDPNRTARIALGCGGTVQKANSVTMGAWSDGLPHPRTCLCTTCDLAFSFKSGVTHIWSSRRPRSDVSQSCAR